MNVLLLTMSTFGKDANFNSKNYYSYDAAGDTIITGYAQMEPVPKLLGRMLNRAGKKLDRIIILESGKTQEPVEITIDDELKSIFDEKFLRENRISFSEEGTVIKISAVDFFKKNITADSQDHLSEVEFFDIAVDDKNMFKALKQVVDILTLSAEDSVTEGELPGCNLYLDIHGGQRDNQLLTDAIVSSLKIKENIKLEATFSISGYSKSKEKPEPIRLVDNRMKSFDLVAGISEFINYGRSASLEQYFENGSEQARRLVECIRNIGDAIQLCDMKSFADKLLELKQALDGLHHETIEDELQIIKEFILEDYGKLLEDHTNRIYQVAWCLKHAFYQQALTIIESQMPEFFFEKHIIGTILLCLQSDNLEGEGATKSVELQVIDDEERKEELLASRNTLTWKPTANFIFEKFCGNLKEGESGNPHLVDLEGKKMLRIWAGYCTPFGENEEKSYKLERLLRQHYDLKQQRNDTNHASAAKRWSVKEIKEEIEDYIEKYQELTVVSDMIFYPQFYFEPHASKTLEL